MTALPFRRDRFVRIVSLTASSAPFESAAANKKANAILRAANLSWNDVIIEDDPLVNMLPEPLYPSQQMDFALLQRHLPALRPWEEMLVRELAKLATLSPQQLAVLNDLSASLRTRGLS